VPASLPLHADSCLGQAELTGYSAEDRNLSLSPCTRAGFNETRGNIISFEVLTPLSNLIETDQHIQKLSESE